jgi:hypothetical protein
MLSLPEVTTMKRVVVAVLLAVWSFPAVSLARSTPSDPPAFPALVTGKAARGDRPKDQASAEASALAGRERQAADLQDFRGGGVTIYIGSGVLLIVVIVLLVLLL